MNHGPPTKRRKLNENESIPPHAENRLVSKKRKDVDGDTIMTQTVPPQPQPPPQPNTNPTDTDEKQNAPNDSPIQITPAPAHPSQESFAFSNAPGGVQKESGEDFMMFSQLDAGRPNLKTEMEMDMMSHAGDNGLDVSQIKIASFDTDSLFEKTKMQCELVWKLHGSLHSRYKNDMTAKEETWQKRVEELAAAHSEEMTVQRREHDQYVRELGLEHRRNLQEQKEETERRLETVTRKNDDLQSKIDDRDITLSKLREEKSMLEKNYGELSSAYEALKTRFEGARALFLGPSDIGSGLPSTPASSDGNPSKGPKSKKRRLSEI